MKTPEFTYVIKGVTLDMCDMAIIKQTYEIYCTTEYLMDNYELNEEQALRYAADVRRLMDKYGYTEDEAIDEILNK